MSKKVEAVITYYGELPLFKQREKWRANYTFKIKEGKTIIKVEASDSNAFRAIINELTRYFVAAEKIDKLLEKLL